MVVFPSLTAFAAAAAFALAHAEAARGANDSEPAAFFDDETAVAEGSRHLQQQQQCGVGQMSAACVVPNRDPLNFRTLTFNSKYSKDFMEDLAPFGTTKLGGCCSSNCQALCASVPNVCITNTDTSCETSGCHVCESTDPCETFKKCSPTEGCIFEKDQSCKRAFRRGDRTEEPTKIVSYPLFPVTSGSFRQNLALPNSLLSLDQFSSNVNTLTIVGLTNKNTGVILEADENSLKNKESRYKAVKMDVYIKFKTPDTSDSSAAGQADRNNDGVAAVGDFKRFHLGISSKDMSPDEWLGYAGLSTGERVKVKNANVETALVPSGTWLYCKITVSSHDNSVSTSITKKDYDGRSLGEPYDEVRTTTYPKRSKIRKVLDRSASAPIVLETSAVAYGSEATFEIGEFRIEYTPEDDEEVQNEAVEDDEEVQNEVVEADPAAEVAEGQEEFVESAPPAPVELP